MDAYQRPLVSYCLITTIIRYTSIHYYDIIALLQILSTFQIILNLVCHKPTK